MPSQWPLKKSLQVVSSVEQLTKLNEKWFNVLAQHDQGAKAMGYFFSPLGYVVFSLWCSHSCCWDLQHLDEHWSNVTGQQIIYSSDTFVLFSARVRSVRSVSRGGKIRSSHGAKLGGKTNSKIHSLLEGYVILYLFGGLEHFSIYRENIIPTDFHIFQRGWNHQPDM